MYDGGWFLENDFPSNVARVSAETNEAFADAFVNLLQVIPEKQPQGVVEATGETMAILRNIAMPISAVVAGTLAIASHGAHMQTFSNMSWK